jgi:bifunctional DNA-binding transcriptional regulator/antitoxin component of YhaV-PrlF toxin-antitoxin module
MATTKRQRVGHTRISTGRRITIPVEALRGAGLETGDWLRIEAAGVGRIVAVRVGQALSRHAGRLTGVYPRGYLGRLRREWR